MKLSQCLSVIGLLIFTSLTIADEPKVIVEGLNNPVGVVATADGIFVSEAGEEAFERTFFGAATNTKADGRIVKIVDGKAVPFVEGLIDPTGIAAYQKVIYVADIGSIWKIDAKGNKKLHVGPNAFPNKVYQLAALTVDPESGTLFVSDLGYPGPPMGVDRIEGTGLYQITPKGMVSRISAGGSVRVTGLAMDGKSHLLVAGKSLYPPGHFATLFRIKLSDQTIKPLASEALKDCTSMVWDYNGRLWTVDSKQGNLRVIPKPGKAPVVVKTQGQPSSIALNNTGDALLVADRVKGTLSSIPLTVPTQEVNQTPLPIRTEVAFPKIQWEGWTAETDEGRPNPLRPIFFTHDNANKEINYLATEQGVIYRFKNDPNVTEGKIFLNLTDKVKYDDRRNEEGLLGLAFHPKFKENGEFFVFYTVQEPDLTNVVSRFRVMKDDPTKADPASEEVLLTYKKPYWNHDGGTLAFGPDGYLYIVHGDGGLANDPHDNAQNKQSLLGKILRIDVDHQGTDTAYAIPKDNPFVDDKEFRPEIWAWGLRNPWRFAFDRKTGQLWAGDVGQNLYEEIDLIEKGKNYGWNRREGFHPFGAKGSGVDPKYTDPIWEYHHDVGKSITGGVVYHGPAIPELEGYYVYADYVASKLWALKYDPKLKRVVENRPLISPGRAIMSFGEDADGEVYLLTLSGNGFDGILKYAK